MSYNLLEKHNFASSIHQNNLLFKQTEISQSSSRRDLINTFTDDEPNYSSQNISQLSKKIEIPLHRSTPFVSYNLIDLTQKKND